jgi:hypothetical protein
MALDLGLVTHLKITETKCVTFFHRVEALMQAQPYHNFTHICDVTQAVYSILRTSNIVHWLTPNEITASFLAAVCHDLDHPGNSNALEVSEKTPLAQKYSDSPLENHHAELALQLIEEVGILKKLCSETQQTIKKEIVSLILATDMSKHRVKTADMEKLLKDNAKDTQAIRHDPEKKSLILQNIMKCADISNQARCKAAADFWNKAIYSEFYAEGDLNEQRGRTVLPHMIRETNNIAKSSVAFGKGVVQPMFELVLNFLKQAAKSDDTISSCNLELAIDNIAKNSSAYLKEVQSQKGNKGGHEQETLNTKKSIKSSHDHAVVQAEGSSSIIKCFNEHQTGTANLTRKLAMEPSGQKPETSTK